MNEKQFQVKGKEEGYFDEFATYLLASKAVSNFEKEDKENGIFEKDYYFIDEVEVSNNKV